MKPTRVRPVDPALLVEITASSPPSCPEDGSIVAGRVPVREPAGTENPPYYRFLTASQLAGLSRDQVMPVVSAKDLALIGMDRFVFAALFTTEWLLSPGPGAELKD